jgi:hypothetical protein
MVLILIYFPAALSVHSQDAALLRDHYRLPYNHPDLIVDLGVGIWAIPFPCDWDGDGVRDLLVGCEDGFFYLFKRDSTQTLLGTK